MSRLTMMVLVGAGGFAGSICRYLTAVFFTKTLPSAFPLGTFVVNVAGCFIIGVLYGLSRKFGWFTSQWNLLLVTGFCGGFTTFSSFAYENIALLQKSEYFTFAAYSASSFVFGLIAVFLGLTLIEWIV